MNIAICRNLGLLFPIKKVEIKPTSKIKAALTRTNAGPCHSEARLQSTKNTARFIMTAAMVITLKDRRSYLKTYFVYAFSVSLLEKNKKNSIKYVLHMNYNAITIRLLKKR